MYYLN